MVKEKMKSFNVKLLLVSLILALITTYVGYSYLKRIEEASVKKPKYIKILVAAEDIPKRTKIEPSMIKEIEVIQESYLLSSIQNKDEIIGMFTKEIILAGEPIPAERLIEENKEDLSLRIPVGKRGISISADEMGGVGDLIKPGDSVDVYVTFDEYVLDGKNTKTLYKQMTKLLLQNIQVLAISKEMERTDDQRLDTPVLYSITLAVNTEEGERLIFGEDSGKIKLALRPLNDKNIYDTSGIIRHDLTPEKGRLTTQK